MSFNDGRLVRDCYEFSYTNRAEASSSVWNWDAGCMQLFVHARDASDLILPDAGTRVPENKLRFVCCSCKLGRSMKKLDLGSCGHGDGPD